MSGRKNVLKTFHSVVAGSMAGDVTSPVTDISFLDNLTVQIGFTGTPTGTFSIECSLDYVPGGPGASAPLNAGTWTALNLSPTPTAAGAAGSYLLDLNQLGSPYLRVKYTRTSGTGTLDVYVAGKSL